MQNQKEQNTNKNNHTGYYLLITLFLVFLGFIFSSQAKRQVEIKHSKAVSMRQLDDLVVVLKETQNKNKNLEKKVTNLMSELHNLDNEKLTISSPTYKKMYNIAGLTKVKGQGLTIKLQDKPVPPELNNEGDNLYLNDEYGSVQSEDLLKLTNELKSAGATAISINGQRLVTTSEIVTAGSNIMVNQTRLMSPYEIKAIGDTEVMASALRIRGSVLETLEIFGVIIEINKSNVIIPAYTGEY